MMGRGWIQEVFSFKTLMTIITTAVVTLALFAIFSPIGKSKDADSPVWTWECHRDRCEKLPVVSPETAQSAQTCKLKCDPWSTLWPKPRGKNVDLKNGHVLAINPYSVSVEIINPGGLHPRTLTLAQEAAQLFQQRLVKRAHKLGRDDIVGRSLEVLVNIKNDLGQSLHLDTEESYSLNVTEKSDSKVVADISAESFFGARHGLETLSQLAVYDDIKRNLLVLSNVYVSDSPAFPHRGILLDTARSYFSVEAIKRTIDAMSLNKMNTFHWHITDSQSFPFVSPSFPNFSKYGAYTPSKVYTPEDIKSIVHYAQVRGVKVIPEFDAPAHVGEGWQWVGHNATVCFKAEPWRDYCVEPPCGQLNPTSEKVYELLAGIYKDMLNVFDSDIFHMGGDEVNINCWNTSSVVTDWMEKNEIPKTHDGFIELWDRFQSRAYSLLVEANNKKELPIVLWTSGLTEKENVDKYLDTSRYIIQIWTTGKDELMSTLVKKGFRVIFSNYDALYFDCGFGAWVGEGNNWCSPYIGWQKVYDNNAWTMLKQLGVDVSESSPIRKLVLGSEATLWSEQADDLVLDSRLWPRAAALAERLWTDPEETWRSAEVRFLIQAERLKDIGISIDTVQPEWCLQNQGYCYSP